jgi:hypothetical protein
MTLYLLLADVEGRMFFLVVSASQIQFDASAAANDA